MSCNGQLELGKVQADKQGLLDDTDYIEGTTLSHRATGAECCSSISQRHRQLVSSVCQL